MAKKRNNQEYPGLDKSKNLKIRQELMDQDYIDKLNPVEKDWLDRFNREFNGAEFNHGGEVLHKTKKLRKSCEKRNNDRNADEYSIAGAKKKLDPLNVTNGVGASVEVVNTTTRLDQNETVMAIMLDNKASNDRELLWTKKKKRRKKKKKS